MCSLLRKSVFVCLIVSLLISGAISTSHSSNKIKLEKEVGIVVPVAGVTDMPNEVTLRMYNSNTAATPLTSQTFLRGEYSAYYNIIKSDGLTEMNVVKFEIKFTNFDKFLDYLDIVKKTENFWIEVDFDGRLIGQREQLDRQTTNQILATVNAQTADTSDPSSAQSAAQTGSTATSGTNYQSGSSSATATSQGSSQIGSAASATIMGAGVGQILYNIGGGPVGASHFYYDDINNRVGLGTASPGMKLSLFNGDFIVDNAPGSGNANSGIRIVANVGTAHTNWLIGAQRLGSYFELTPSTAAGGTTFSTPAVAILETGRVGIGTTSPGSRLSVGGGDFLVNNSPSGSANSGIRIVSNAGITHTNWLIGNQRLGSYFEITPSTAVDGTTFSTPAVVILQTGNVGIGTTSPCVDCKLAVNGKIRAKEIVVDTAWSDFVFYDNYALMPLQEVEKFIKEKQHLPGIPTAADIEKEGVSLGTISAKLLQKIEELTLYVIDLKKANDDLKGDLAALQKQMDK